MRLPIRLEAMNHPRSRSYGAGNDFKRRNTDAGLFWWTILITFLLVMTAGSWIFSLYLFAFPEKSFNYRMLARLEKLKALEKFTARSVPAGKFHNARELYQKFYHFTGEQLQGTNGKLKRSYLWNYEGREPIYVKGSFRVAKVRALEAGDYFTSGILVEAYAVEDVEKGALLSDASGSEGRVFPNAVFEFVFPAAEVPDALFAEGQEITVDSAREYASLLNIERVDSDRLCFTAVPLLYGTYQVSDSKILSLAPPQRVNVDAPWPISGTLSRRSNAATAAGDTAEEPRQEVTRGV